MEDKKYFSKAWSLLTRDKGWFKPLLVMTVAELVPVAGALGNTGYGLEWARLTAWNIDSSPKQKNVSIGACIASGWRGFVVSLGWSLLVGVALGVITEVFDVIPGSLGSLLQILASLGSMVVYIIMAPILRIAQLRAAIYERISAGYRMRSVFEMIGRDKSGFFKLVLISLCSLMVIFIASLIFGVILIVPLAPVIYAAYTYDSHLLVTAFSQTLVWLVLILIITYFVLAFFFQGIYLVNITAAALWMRQFDVASWGRSEDPLPAAKEQEWHVPTQPSESWSEPSAQAPVQNEPYVEQPMQSEPYVQTPVESAPAVLQEQQPVLAAAPEVQTEREVFVEQAGADVQAPEEPAGEPDTEPTIRLESRRAKEAPELSAEPLEVPDKGVDELYEDLYDVMQGSSHSDPPADED